MGVFDKLSQAFGVATAKELSIDEYMNAAEMDDVDAIHEVADMYVKPISVSGEDDIKLVEEELAKTAPKTILLMSIEELAKRPTTRNNVVTHLKNYVNKINGDIAQIDETRIMLTPAKVKIVKRRRPKE